jgi:ribose transport system permease protein
MRRLKQLQEAAVEHGIDLSPLIPIGVLIATVLAIDIAEPAYLSSTSIESSLVTAAPILLLTIGSSLVILTGGLDLSVGGVAAVTSVLFAKAFNADGALVGFLLVFAGALVFGGLQGWVQTKAQVPSFILTLGTLGILTGLALKLSNGSPVITESGTGLLDWLIESTAGIPNPFVMVLISLVVLGGLLRWTRLGRSVYAVGSAEPAGRISGVRLTRVRIFVFAASAGMASLAACSLMAQSGAGGATLGEGLLLPTIAAVVVGGTAVSGGIGGIGRAVIGGLIISAVTTGTAVTGLNSGLQQIVFGFAIIAAIAVTTDRRRSEIVK